MLAAELAVLDGYCNATGRARTDVIPMAPDSSRKE